VIKIIINMIHPDPPRNRPNISDFQRKMTARTLPPGAPGERHQEQHKQLPHMQVADLCTAATSLKALRVFAEQKKPGAISRFRPGILDVGPDSATKQNKTKQPKYLAVP
jgi:hypothetical protein